MIAPAAALIKLTGRVEKAPKHKARKWRALGQLRRQPAKTIDAKND